MSVSEKTRTSGAPPAGRSGGMLLGQVVRLKELSILLVTVVAAIWFTATSDAFNSVDNYHTIVQYVAPWAIIAAGEVLLLICGEIDLSAGFVYTLSPFVLVIFHNNGVPLLLALLLALALSAAIGVLNGLIRTRFGLPSFIVTLGMAFLLEGVSLIVSNGSPVPAPDSGALVAILGGAYWSELIWTLLVVAVLQVVLSATRFGVHTQAVGGNPVGAAESGIRTDRVKIACFAVTSFLAALGGVIDGTRVGSYDPTNGGFDTMFLAVASAVIGGTALLGGSGTVVGALLGSLLLGIVYDGFNLTGVSANAFDVVLGIAILVAMLLNVRLAALQKRAGRPPSLAGTGRT